MTMDAAAVREYATDMPTSPGCYQFLSGETMLYVGKAVDLRSRVRSYADPRSERVARMVASADDIDWAVTDTETQALLLEANLIKRNQPRYNVRLKDDKSYPLVQLTDHPAPRIEITRDPDESALVFGPFTNRGRLEDVVKAIRDVYGLRGCSDHKFATRDRPCLDYDIGICSAPCTGEISEDAYAEAVDAAIRYFRGETGVLSQPLQEEMDAAASEHRYERAAHVRDRLQIVESIHGEVARAITGEAETRTEDILGVDVRGDRATVARLHSENGQLIERERHRVSLPDDTEPSMAAVIAAFIPQYYADRRLPDTILVPEDPADRELSKWLGDEDVDVRVPGAGRGSTLVDLALKNARMGGTRLDGAGALADALGIDPPSRIEGFDVSHAQGRAVVGSNVVFLDGEPHTDGYRRKKLEEQNNDYENMYALVRWRAARSIEDRDDRPDPDLLLIDGGAGQLTAAQDALEETGWGVPVIALAKRAERVLDGDRTYDWDPTDPGLHLLQRVRDEAHRFAVGYHQSVRDDVSTALEGIEGIGPERRRNLLRRFGSIEGVRAASADELTDVEGIGQETATTLAQRL